MTSTRTPNTRLTTTALLLVVVAAASAFFPTCHAFVPFRSLSRPSILVDVVVVSPTKGPMVASLWALDNDTETTSSEKESSSSLSSSPTPPTTAKLTLEEKMKAWEATEEEVKAATLGGIVVPKGTNNDDDDGSRSDAFDVGLYILFPFMVLSGLAFAFFPFIMGNLDLEGVGPPPTM